MAHQKPGAKATADCGNSLNRISTSKPFACRICKKTYVLQSSVNRHLKKCILRQPASKPDQKDNDTSEKASRKEEAQSSRSSSPISPITATALSGNRGQLDGMIGSTSHARTDDKGPSHSYGQSEITEQSTYSSQSSADEATRDRDAALFSPSQPFSPDRDHDSWHGFKLNPYSNSRAQLGHYPLMQDASSFLPMSSSARDAWDFVHVDQKVWAVDDMSPTTHEWSYASDAYQNLEYLHRVGDSFHIPIRSQASDWRSGGALEKGFPPRSDDLVDIRDEETSKSYLALSPSATQTTRSLSSGELPISPNLGRQSWNENPEVLSYASNFNTMTQKPLYVFSPVADDSLDSNALDCHNM